MPPRPSRCAARTSQPARPPRHTDVQVRDLASYDTALGTTSIDTGIDTGIASRTPPGLTLVGMILSCGQRGRVMATRTRRTAA